MKKFLAFTLIELLVVITIIAILASIALPVYSGIMERGRATADASNLRQIGVATLAYANDNSDILFTTNAFWPSALAGNSTYLSGTKVFQSPLDTRAKVEGANAPVSYGLNTNVYLKNSSKFTNTSTLYLFAGAPNPAATNALAYIGVYSENVPVSKPAGLTPRLGTHSDRRQINVLFADWHVENVKWTSYAGNGTTNWVP